jgi:hypothetical protein
MKAFTEEQFKRWFAERGIDPAYVECVCTRDWCVRPPGSMEGSRVFSAGVPVWQWTAVNGSCGSEHGLIQIRTCPDLDHPRMACDFRTQSLAKGRRPGVGQS